MILDAGIQMLKVLSVRVEAAAIIIKPDGLPMIVERIVSAVRYMPR